MSSSGGGAPSLDTVAGMKSFLSAQGVSFADCVEKSDLQRRVRETQAKMASGGAGAGAAQQVRACDCMQGAPHSHGDAAAAAAAASSTGTAADNGSAIVRSIAVGPLQCNCTIVADPVTKEAVLIDPGGDADKIFALIKEMGVKVVLVLVTHAHFDHFLAAEEVRKHTGAKVALHAADKMLWAALPMQLMMLGMAALAPKTPVAAPEVELTDGMELPVCGGRVLHTPGHSPGSCCFYFPKAHLCATGDTLFAGSVGRTDLMGGDSAALVRSIQTKLYSLPPEVKCIPGHGPSATIGHEAKNNGVVKAKSSAL